MWSLTIFLEINLESFKSESWSPEWRRHFSFLDRFRTYFYEIFYGTKNYLSISERKQISINNKHLSMDGISSLNEYKIHISDIGSEISPIKDIEHFFILYWKRKFQNEISFNHNFLWQAFFIKNIFTYNDRRTI